MKFNNLLAQLFVIRSNFVYAILFESCIKSIKRFDLRGFLTNWQAWFIKYNLNYRAFLSSGRTHLRGNRTRVDLTIENRAGLLHKFWSCDSILPPVCCSCRVCLLPWILLLTISPSQTRRCRPKLWVIYQTARVYKYFKMIREDTQENLPDIINVVKLLFMVLYFINEWLIRINRNIVIDQLQ